MTPDPAGDFVADVANPQSWNQYAYVMNNPTNWIDPNGLVCDRADGTSYDPPPAGPNALQCTQLGGTWIKPVQTWVNVSSDGSSSGADGNAGNGNEAKASNNCMVVNGSTVCKSFIDTLNLLEKGKTSYRDSLPICSAHVTIDNSTGETQSHVDLFNPQGSLPSATPGVPNIPLLPLHLIFDAVPDAIYRITGRYIFPAGRNNCQ